MNDPVTKAREIASTIAAPHAARHDKERSFPTETFAALAESGLLGLTVPKDRGGLGLGPRAFRDVVVALAEADASAAMIFVMHVCGTACILGAPRNAVVDGVVADIAKGKHLSTLAFSERGSRSHFWAPVSKAQKAAGGASLTAYKSWVTSANFADSYVSSALSPEGKGALDSTLYLVRRTQPGVAQAGAFEGLGLCANDSGPVKLEGVLVPDDLRLTDDGAGMKAMLEVVLPLFNLGQASLAVGICRAVTGATVSHLKTAQFEHLGASLGEALPNLRANLANMQNDTDGLAARLEDLVYNLENPSAVTVLRVLQAKAVAGETAIRVTSDAMRTCGGAAFSKHTAIERFFRDAHAGAVMAPTVDVLKEFIGKALLGIPLF